MNQDISFGVLKYKEIKYQNVLKEIQESMKVALPLLKLFLAINYSSSLLFVLKSESKNESHVYVFYFNQIHCPSLIKLVVSAEISPLSFCDQYNSALLFHTQKIQYVTRENTSRKQYVANFEHVKK